MLLLLELLDEVLLLGREAARDVDGDLDVVRAARVRAVELGRALALNAQRRAGSRSWRAVGQLQPQRPVTACSPDPTCVEPDALEDALEALVQEPDGAKREKLKVAAAQLLVEFQKELDSPFFQVVADGNGFRAVNVRGAAMESLGKVRAALTEAA